MCTQSEGILCRELANGRLPIDGTQMALHSSRLFPFSIDTGFFELGAPCLHMHNSASHSLPLFQGRHILAPACITQHCFLDVHTYHLLCPATCSPSLSTCLLILMPSPCSLGCMHAHHYFPHSLGRSNKMFDFALYVYYLSIPASWTC